MFSPDYGEGFKAPPPQKGGSTLKDVDVEANIMKSTKNPFLLQSLLNGSTTEKFLTALLIYKEIDQTIAKELYGETRLVQHASDISRVGLIVDRRYTRNPKGGARAFYFLPSVSKPLAQKRINELRIFRSSVSVIEWHVCHVQ